MRRGERVSRKLLELFPRPLGERLGPPFFVQSNRLVERFGGFVSPPGQDEYFRLPNQDLAQQAVIP
jgi:hypothetical protein